MSAFQNYTYAALVKNKTRGSRDILHTGRVVLAEAIVNLFQHALSAQGPLSDE